MYPSHAYGAYTQFAAAKLTKPDRSRDVLKPVLPVCPWA